MREPIVLGLILLNAKGLAMKVALPGTISWRYEILEIRGPRDLGRVST